jgi:tetratricopeptide (TPR) repeat protein
VPAPRSPRVFINYRREDTKEVARALHSELERVLGRGAAFLDHKEIEPGASFPEALKREVEQADVVLVLVGPRWLTLQSADGVRRLDEPDDWVRTEIELALRTRKWIVPVLVDGAAPLATRAFRTVPAIEGLANLQARPLTTVGWEEDFERIVALLEGRGFSRGDRSEHGPAGPLRAALFRSNVHARGNKPFVGRGNLLEEMARLLDGGTAPQFLALFGPPGVGKSELAREFARNRQGHYPGGTFTVDASTGGPPVDLVTVCRLLGRPPADYPRMEDQCIAALISLGSVPTLLIYDNVLSPEWADAWLPFAGMACHVVVTSHASTWDARWHALRVLPLDDRESRQLIEAVSTGFDMNEHVAGLVRASEGLPVQLLPAARSLLAAAHSGRAPLPESALADETRSSFEGPWRRLAEEGRTFLMAATFLHPDRIDLALLRDTLTRQPGWSNQRVQSGVEACRDLFLVTGDDILQMHRLLARFVTEKGRDSGPLLATLRRPLWARLLNTADLVEQGPGNAGNALQLLAFDTSLGLWMEDGRTGAGVGAEAHRVASALSALGRFEAARLWAERAVAEKQTGDIDGRVDPEDVGTSLDLVGNCLAETGKHDEARPWFERAVAEKQKGNADGRVDPGSLGRSLHQVGDCLAETGKYDEARTWFERAVTEKQKGDAHGRIDPESLGTSLHEVGDGLAQTGKYDEARPWFERAVTEKQKGNVEGRVDSESLGTSLHQLGSCLAETGKYDEARTWFERAVTEARKGDAHHRVDPESVGRSLHQVGYCLARTGRHDEARPWFERAVAEAEKGDVYGRVDPVSLGISLHQVGSSLAETGKYDQARPWFERAVTEKQKGNLHGRMDPASLGISLHEVGRCLARKGRHGEARPWFERAVVEKQKGNIHGRVDPARLGTSLHEVGECLAQTGRYDEARAWFERAVAERQKGDVHGRVDRASVTASEMALLDMRRRVAASSL